MFIRSFLVNSTKSLSVGTSYGPMFDGAAVSGQTNFGVVGGGSAVVVVVGGGVDELFVELKSCCWKILDE